jgi:hypothetical protein
MKPEHLLLASKWLCRNEFRIIGGSHVLNVADRLQLTGMSRFVNGYWHGASVTVG